MTPYSVPPMNYYGAGARPDMYRGMSGPGQRMGDIAGDRYSRGPYESAVQGSFADPYSAPSAHPIYPLYFAGGYPAEDANANRIPAPYGAYPGRLSGGVPEGFQGHGIKALFEYFAHFPCLHSRRSPTSKLRPLHECWEGG